MIKALRDMDELYFGPGHRSAVVMALMILTRVTPWEFVRRYRRGDFN